MAKSELLRTDTCPVARTVSIIGDRWSLLIIRDAFDGTRRFTDFQRNLGVARNILTERLKMLVEEKILDLAPASDGSMYQEYVLTVKGEELFPLVVALRQWGERHLYKKGERHSQLLDIGKGRSLKKIEIHTSDGALVTGKDVRVKKVVPAGAEAAGKPDRSRAARAE